MADISDKIIDDGLTFDDVLLVPAYSEVIPRAVNLQTQFSKNISLNLPLVSAAMDTVTETEMAISIARTGGIGVIHKNMMIEDQAAQVRKVKRAENTMINNPISIEREATVGDVINLMQEYKIGGIPVVNEQLKLQGIVTNRDLRFQSDMKRPIDEVMTKENLVTTREHTTLDQATEILEKYKIEKLPVVDHNNTLIGLITYKDITKVKANPNSCKDEHGRLQVAAAVGISAHALDRAKALVEAGVDALVIDTAHGHTKTVLQLVKDIKKKQFPVDIIVGNIGTLEAARALKEAGVDAVKVGIGPGSICTTRIVAGVGVPQLSAIYNVSNELKGSGIPLIADGGIRYSGDIVKAIAAGANSVMVGSLFAGVEESPGKTIIYNGRKFKAYRGMGSIEAMQTGSKDRYFQDMEDDIKKLVPEGIAARVPYKGTLEEVAYQLEGGLRAGMGYCGAENINHLQNAKFMRVTSSGIIESHAHDVTITSEAPNYSRSLFESKE